VKGERASCLLRASLNVRWRPSSGRREPWITEVARERDKHSYRARANLARDRKTNRAHLRPDRPRTYTRGHKARPDYTEGAGDDR
jgi:hypothetical protein